VYRDEGLFERAASLAPVLEDAVHSLKGLRHVVDCRNLGLIGAVELAPRPGLPGARAFEVFLKCWEKGVMIRTTGDIIAFSPALIAKPEELQRIVQTVADVLPTVE
jgi:beta-alanine--pyruvate transaminase